MGREVLGLLTNRTNQAILSLLAVEPSYPRRVAALLALSEPEVARRLRAMEHAGLVAGSWANIGKNVKLYRLVAEGFSLRFTPEGLRAELHGAADGARAGGWLVQPHELPVPAPGEFVGRERELAALDGPEPVVVVEGMPGIGKTSLLARYAELCAGRRAVFWHGFRGAESLGWLANRVGLARARAGDRALLDAVLGDKPTDKHHLLLATMDDPAWAFLLDDVHLATDPAVAGLLRDAIQSARRGKVVLAGRERPGFQPGSHVKVLHLGGLEDEAVAALLGLRGVPLPPELLPKLRAEVGGHPLALLLLLETASQLQVPVAQLLDRVPERNLEDYLLREVAAALRPEEREALAHASVFRTRFTADDLAAVSRRNPEAALWDLRRRSLVQAFEGEYALHEVLRNFFYAHLRSKAELHERAAQRYLAQGTVEGHLEALHHFLEAGQRGRVLDLLERNFDLREFDVIDAGYHVLYLDVLDAFRREEVRDARRWALMEDERGDLRYHRGERDRALEHWAAARAHFLPAGDAGRIADLGWKRGLALAELGRPREAREACDEGLAHAAPGTPARERLEALGARLA